MLVFILLNFNIQDFYYTMKKDIQDIKVINKRELSHT